MTGFGPDQDACRVTVAVWVNVTLAAGGLRRVATTENVAVASSRNDNLQALPSTEG